MVTVTSFLVILLLIFWFFPVFIQVVSYCVITGLSVVLVVGVLGLLRSPR